MQTIYSDSKKIMHRDTMYMYNAKLQISSLKNCDVHMYMYYSVCKMSFKQRHLDTQRIKNPGL